MSAFKTILTAALAMLVLLSSSSFMIGVHRCAGEVRHVGIFSRAQVCEMELLPPCHRALKKSCCEDQTIVHQGDDIKPAFSHLQMAAPQATDIARPQVLIAEVIPASFHARTGYVHYDPPLRWDDITIDHQVLLI